MLQEMDQPELNRRAALDSAVAASLHSRPRLRYASERER